MADYSTVTIRPFNPTGNVANIGLAWTQWVEELILFFGAKDVTKPMVKCNQLLYYGGERVQQIWKTLPESTAPFDVNIHGQAQQVNERPPTSEEAALATSISALRVVVDQATLRLAAAAPEDIDSATALHSAAHTALDKARNCLLAARTAVTSQRTSRIEHPAPKDEFDYLLYALNRVFVGQTSNTYNRFQFNNLRPDARETSSQFLIKLKGKIKSCNFADQEQTLIDMLISHTSNNELRRELLKKGDELNFDTALMISRTVEATESQARAIEGSSSTEQIAKVFSHNKKTGTCHRCGKSDHYANDPVCRARYKTCSRCNKTGHFAEVCRSSGSGSIPKYPMAAKEKPPVFKKEKKFTYKKGRIHKVEHEDLNFVQSSSSADFAFSIDGRFRYDTEKSIRVNVGGVELQFEIDSCSSTNIISSATWENCKRRGIKCKSTRITKDLYPYNSLTPLKTIGKFECELKVGRFISFDEVYVVHGNDKSLLSERTSKALQVLKVGLHVQRESIRAVTKATENQYHDAATLNTRRATSVKQQSRAMHQQPVASTADRKQINTATNNTNITENKGNLQLKQEIIQEFPEVFTGMGKLKDYELELVIDPSMAPALQPLRPVPLQQQPKVEKKLEELLNCDIIEPVNYPSKFCSPLHVANKPDNEIRFCVDMRVANLCVQRLNHPIPRFEEVCSNLKGSTVFSKLDMKNAYFQIQLSKESREITTFSTHKGLFRYKRLFCGINCAPEAFQKIMEIATKDCEGLEVYIDDFLIHGATREIHDQRLHSHTKMLATAVNTDTWPVELRKYELIKTELCVYDDVILRGIVKTKQRLRSKVWWFTMDKDVEEFCKHCHGCQIVAPFELPEPLQPTALPTGSWKDIAIDYLGPFPNGKNILVVIDYYSRFIEAVITTSTTAATTINILEEIFCRFGYPESMRADQAPQLSGSEMRDYCLLNGIRLVSTTPRYPQANGEVERQNRSIMKVLKIANAEKDDLQKALNTYLLAYRSTPHSVTGVSPAKLMFNREIRDKLPNLYVQVALEQSVRDRDAEYKASSKDYTDRARRASQKKLEIGDDVLVRQQVQNKLDTQYCPVPFQITAKDGNAITVRAPSGTEYRRNSTWAKPYQPPLPETDTELSTLEEKQQDNSSPVVAQSPVRARVQELQQKETLANTPIRRSNRERHAPKRLITEC
ncbi:hypothetical protein B566_EDAN014122 [Ephemera danica]|nr:hypothetical protein B566_EDAN014122 [Ephemera danica]